MSLIDRILNICIIVYNEFVKENLNLSKEKTFKYFSVLLKIE